MQSRTEETMTQAEKDKDEWKRYLDKITAPPPVPYKPESMESLISQARKDGRAAIGF
jgi:hypothetical protein